MSTIWQILCLAGAWGWVLCTMGLIVAGFPRRGVFAGRPALYWGGAVVVSFALWVLAMSNA